METPSLITKPLPDYSRPLIKMLSQFARYQKKRCHWGNIALGAMYGWGIIALSSCSMCFLSCLARTHPCAGVRKWESVPVWFGKLWRRVKCVLVGRCQGSRCCSIGPVYNCYRGINCPRIYSINMKASLVRLYSISPLRFSCLGAISRPLANPLLIRNRWTIECSLLRTASISMRLVEMRLRSLGTLFITGSSFKYLRL